MNIEGFEFSDYVNETRSIPSQGGVYALIFEGHIEYIGVTGNIKRRFMEHRCRMMRGFDFSICWILGCDIPNGMSDIHLEEFLIDKIRPFRNRLNTLGDRKKKICMTGKNINISSEIAKKSSKLAKSKGISFSNLVESCLMIAINESEVGDE